METTKEIIIQSKKVDYQEINARSKDDAMATTKKGSFQIRKADHMPKSNEEVMANQLKKGKNVT